MERLGLRVRLGCVACQGRLVANIAGSHARASPEVRRINRLVQRSEILLERDRASCGKRGRWHLRGAAERVSSGSTQPAKPGKLPEDTRVIHGLPIHSWLEHRRLL